MTVNVTAFIGRTEVPDKPSDFKALKPTALSSFHVNWGRSNPTAQPQASTAEIVVALDPAKPLPDWKPKDPLTLYGYTKAPAIELRLDVTLRHNREGELTYKPVRDYDRQETAHDDTGIIYDLQQGYENPQTVNMLEFPPALSAVNPFSWNNLPRTTAGSEVHVYAGFSLPPSWLAKGASLEVYPCFYTSPQSVVTYHERGKKIAQSPGRATYLAPESNLYAGVGYTLTIPESLWTSLVNLHPTSPTVTIASPNTSCTIFTGSISDINVTYDKGIDRPVASITATDALSDLAAVPVGSKPWPQEPAAVRANRILLESDSGLGYSLDALPYGYTLYRRDTDSTSALDLLHEVARSTSSIMWLAASPRTGPRLHFEPIAARGRAFILQSSVPDYDSHYPAYTPHANPPQYNIEIPASEIPRSSVNCRRDFSSHADRVSATYLHSDPHDPENTVNELVTAETSSKRYNRSFIHTHKIATQLTTKDEALHIAEVMLGALDGDCWYLPSLTWLPALSSREDTDERLLTLLDSYRRIGLAVNLTLLPKWISDTPARTVHLDGGDIDYYDGKWQLRLKLDYQESNDDGATYRDFTGSDVYYAEFARSVRYSHMRSTHFDPLRKDPN